MNNKQEKTIYIKLCQYEDNVFIFGLSPQERIYRILSDYGNVIIIDQYTNISEDAYVMVFWKNVIVDHAFIESLLQHPGYAIIDNKEHDLLVSYSQDKNIKNIYNKEQNKKCDIYVIKSKDICSDYRKRLRKKQYPLCQKISDKNKKEIEWTIYKNIYKGITDVVTKLLWPVPTFYITRFLTNINISANVITGINVAMILFVIIMFYNSYLVTGLLFAWLMTLFDTVDGKIARVTVTSSKLGDKIDHIPDAIHPPVWYAAWAVSVFDLRVFEKQENITMIIVLFCCYFSTRLLEELFKAIHKFNIHLWRKFDSVFRLITCRRNPILLILTSGLVIGMPGDAFFVSLIWIIICGIIYTVRVIFSFIILYRKGPLKTWLSYERESIWTKILSYPRSHTDG